MKLKKKGIKQMDKFETMCETYKHKQLVSMFMADIATRIVGRSINHDDSKLTNPEVEIFTEYTPKLAKCTYGSEEYNQYLKEMKVALEIITMLKTNIILNIFPMGLKI